MDCCKIIWSDEYFTFKKIMVCDVDIRKDLRAHIVLSGGFMVNIFQITWIYFPGFPRSVRETKTIFKQAIIFVKIFLDA